MLYIVLILVLAALGLVVTALITADSLWAWISIGLSVLAGLLLLADWLRRRSAGAANAEDTARAEDAASDDEDAESSASTSGEQDGGSVGEAASSPKEPPTAMLPASGELKAPSGDPAEEETDAADLLIVSELEAEVLVVDEYPRYHLAECSWLKDKDTIPLPVREARELGFTPCAVCGPDASLAAAHRNNDKRKSKK
ncbi:hypothetical protein [Prauserella muralis]|uniref:Uncharacterized protein n=1 Tax=Prauserella muralis TaxID=588067 RepID=A0A2V4AIP6_9PSEU|nr:hypothetical protein [Prauserella muralis]PXY19511.1 hypothetical protein BAY60_32785 [Prauserella muralis]TWE29496.1 hypothetical protein FHX69_2181 [Prauserella muralis]